MHKEVDTYRMKLSSRMTDQLTNLPNKQSTCQPANWPTGQQQDKP